MYLEQVSHGRAESRAQALLMQVIRPRCSLRRSLGALASSKLRMAGIAGPHLRPQASCGTLGEPDPKWKVYGELLKHANPDLIDIKAIAEAHQTTPQVVGAYLGTLKNSPNIYRELLKAGYQDPVIPGWVARGTSGGRRGAGRASEDQAEALDKATLGEGVTEAQPGQFQVPGGTYRSRELPEAELQRLGIVQGGDGRYYKATPGTGGSIVLRPVDPNVVEAAAKTGLDVSIAVSEAATSRAHVASTLVVRVQQL